MKLTLKITVNNDSEIIRLKEQCFFSKVITQPLKFAQLSIEICYGSFQFGRVTWRNKLLLINFLYQNKPLAIFTETRTALLIVGKH